MQSLASRLGLAALLVIGSTSAVGCVPPQQDAASPVAAGSSEWISGPTERRKVTVLVRVARPAKLGEQLAAVAAGFKDPDLMDQVRTVMGGSFGSGFLVVHRNSHGTRSFIVTNRHVVEGAPDAEITFGDGTTYKNCEIVFASPTADLAVIALPDSATQAYPVGLRPAAASPTERLTVIASGFPAVGGTPSYQVTEGKVSNAHFSLLKEDLLQHTAAIDPGSSGGPLTNEAGEVVGANVAFIRTRSSMFLAVPASAIAETVRQAHNLVENKKDGALMAQALQASCNAFAAELASARPEPRNVDHFISNQLVAQEGAMSFLYAYSRPVVGPAFKQDLYENPVDGMRQAVAYRTWATSNAAGGATGTCASINPMDAESITEPKPVRLAVLANRKSVELRWAFEQGAWRVAGGNFLDVVSLLATEKAIAEADADADAEPETAPAKTSAPAKKAPAKKTTKVVAKGSK